LLECDAVGLVLDEFCSDELVLLLQLSPLPWKAEGVCEAGKNDYVLKLLERIVCFVIIFIYYVEEDAE
jgi:hypothetical protein